MIGTLQLITSNGGETIESISGQFDSVGTFLLCLNLTVVEEATTYLIKVIRRSTLEDPDTLEIPDDEEIFRTRHVLRSFWNRTNMLVQVQNPSTFLYSWSSSTPFPNLSNNLHYYSPFVKPATWNDNSASPLGTTPSTDPDDRYDPSDSSRVVQPDPVFHVCDLKEGQYLRIETTCYRDDPYRDDASTPYLDDHIPATVEGVPPGLDTSDSEVLVDFAGSLTAWLLRV